MSPAAPSTAEIMRRLDAVVLQLDRLATTLETGFVRKDVQQANDAAIGIQLKGFEDELHMMSKQVDATNTKIDSLTTQRNTERDERDRQRTSDRRLIYTVAFTALAGPLLVAWILHALGGA